MLIRRASEVASAAMDDGDVLESFVPVRPYTPGAAAGGVQRRREGNKFKPILPSERPNVEEALCSSVPEDSVGALLQTAAKRHELERSVGHSAETVVPERFRGMALKRFGFGVGAPGTSTSTTQRLDGVAAPRKVKAMKENRSMELMDLAFTNTRRTLDGQIKHTYAPISLPYFNVAEEEEQEVGTGGASKATNSRPTLMHLDETNATATKDLFLDVDGELLEDQYVLMQLPSVLPEMVDPAEEVPRSNDDIASAGAGASITRLPDGLLGKLRIHKSGKVRMEMGGLPFRVDQGFEPFFSQRLACICPLASEAIDLGPIHKRSVLTPDVAAMLDNIRISKAAEPPTEVHEASSIAATGALASHAAPSVDVTSS